MRGFSPGRAFGSACLALLSAAAGGGIAAEDSAQASAFELVLGAGTPVCDAYAKQLSSMQFETDPYCDRAFESPDATLVSPRRVPLSSEEILRLYSPALGFLRHRDVSYFETHRNAAGERATDHEARDVAAAAARSGGEPLVFRFSPPVDIDDDGKPDDLIGWRPPDNGSCGTLVRDDPVPTRAPTYLLFLDAHGLLDAARTQAVFGHPAGNDVAYRDMGSGARQVVTVPGFRAIGGSLDVFRYRGDYFFDTFYDGKGDLKGERAGAQIVDTIAVFRRKAGKNALMCEIRWKRPPQDD